MKKTLSFANSFFEVTYVREEEIKIRDYGIVTNLSTDDMDIGDKSAIRQYKSCLLHDYELRHIGEAVIVGFDFDPTVDNPELKEFCQKNWHDNKIRYPNNPEKWHYKILMSPKDKVDKWEFSAWFLPARVASSIHNQHPFSKEVHTQIYGLGIMNKFKDQDVGTLYQREYMPPGYTHDIYYDEQFAYPWHQYEAVTDSIWMAIMEE